MITFATWQSKKEIIKDTMTIAFGDRKMISVSRQLINSMNGARIISSGTNVEADKAAAISAGIKAQNIPIDQIDGDRIPLVRRYFRRL